MVLVDTPVWSLSLRRRAVDLSEFERLFTHALYELVKQHRVQLLGSTRQEVLSGIRDESQFQRIRDHLRGFENVELNAGDYEDAAHGSNACRRAGIATSSVDMLICAVASSRNWEIFTTDRDFTRYSKVLKIRLFAAR